jgi:4-hydroxybenzoate polyprenyltransferase
MLTIRCFAAVAAARGEIGKEKFKWTLLFWIVVSYLVSAIIYTVGQFVWPVAIWVVAAVLAVVGIVAYNKYADKKDAKARLLNAKK